MGTKLHLRHRHQIEATQWDAFLEQTPQRVIYAQAWYLDALGSPWSALIETDALGMWQAVLPFHVQKKWGFSKVDQDPLANELGVLTLDERAIPRMLAELRKRYRFISRYSANVHNATALAGAFPSQDTYHLPLSQPYKELKQGFNSNRKRGLKKAHGFSQVVNQSEDITPLLTLWQQEVAHKVYNVQPYQFEQVRRLFQAAAQRGLAKILYVTDAEATLSGALFLRSYQRWIYFMGASSAQGKQQESQTLLFDAFLQEHAGSDQVLDFEGGDLASLGQFYRGFGAEPQPIPYIRSMRYPFPLNLLKKA